jgi:hypothetical protein
VIHWAKVLASRALISVPRAERALVRNRAASADGGQWVRPEIGRWRKCLRTGAEDESAAQLAGRDTDRLDAHVDQAGLQRGEQVGAGKVA